MAKVVTYEALREVQRNERSGEKLYNLEESFFEGVKSYLDKRKEAKDDFAETEIRNAKSILRDILDRRERKIMNKALQASRTGANIDTGTMTSPEKRLFEDLVGLLDKHKFSFGKVQAQKAEKKIEKPREKVKKKRGVMSNKAEKTNRSGYSLREGNDKFLKVKVLEDLPQIVGSDLKDYGPFKKDEVVDLPKENANIFIDNGKVELKK